MFHINPDFSFSFHKQFWLELTFPLSIIYDPNFVIFLGSTVDNNKLFVFTEIYVDIMGGIWVGEQSGRGARRQAETLDHVRAVLVVFRNVV